MRRGVYKILALVLFGFAGVTSLSADTSAISSGQTVQLSVPSTSLQVTGSSARLALVTIELNDVVVGSTTSDSDGMFSHILASVPPGVQKISVQYEVGGRKSLKQTKNVSLQPQQQTTVDFLLPPILYIAGPNEINVSQNIVLEGYSIPNTTITLQSSTGFSLQTITNQSGQYIFSVSGGQFYQADVTFTSLYQLNGQDSAVSNPVSMSISGLDSQINTGQPQQDGSRPDIIVNPLQPTPPVITSPEGAEMSVNGDSVLFRGQAQRGSQIIAYANGQVVGSVIVDQNGDWEFYFSSTDDRVIFQFSACVSQSCSLPSRSVEVRFSIALGVCNIDLRLGTYRFWNITSKDRVTLKSDTYPVNLEVYIDWGDGPTEKFSYDAESQFQYEHVYSNPGVYNGSVRVTIDNCSHERFFSVTVNDHNSSRLFSGAEIRNMIIIIVILFPISIYFYRRPSH